MQAQTSLDPKQMREWIPQITYGAHAFFTSDQMETRDKARRFEYFLTHREEILPWIKEFSAYEWASVDDCEEPRYDGWAGVPRFVCDKMGVEILEE